jgi:DNA-binding transcriptional MerR regulator/methylmalonyl-CoA mutase cobalamin-binding subunit
LFVLVIKKKARHPMGVAVRKTGVSADVIRAWERRHGAVKPVRTAGNHRLYTDADIRRLLIIRRATEAGWQIGQVATLDDAEIYRLLEGDSAASREVRPGAAGAEAIEHHLGRCLDLVEALDSDRLAAQLEEAAVNLSRVELLDRLLVGLMKEVGEGCEDGRLRTAHEHLASAVARSFLGSMRGAYPAADTSPGIVVSTPAFQHHELGALVIAATARSEGWRTVYLGPNLPAEEIAAAVRQKSASVVALSITYPGDDPALRQELRKLKRLVPGEVVLIAGGTSAASYESELSEIGARLLSDPASLRVFLREVRRGA